MQANLGRWTVAAAAVALALSGCTTMKSMTGGGGQLALSGDNEVPPAATNAHGTGTVTVAGDCSVTVNIKVTGMTPTAAHIHQGRAGSDGPVILPLTKQGADTFVAPAGAKFNEAQCAAYKAGNTYVNVHSEKYKGGEVRAQLRGG